LEGSAKHNLSDLSTSKKNNDLSKKGYLDQIDTSRKTQSDAKTKTEQYITNLGDRISKMDVAIAKATGDVKNKLQTTKDDLTRQKDELIGTRLRNQNDTNNNEKEAQAYVEKYIQDQEGLRRDTRGKSGAIDSDLQQGADGEYTVYDGNGKRSRSYGKDRIQAARNYYMENMRNNNYDGRLRDRKK
jgi:hypothetical protein